MEKTLCQYFFEARSRDSKRVAVITKVKAQWKEYSWKEYYQFSENLAHYLKDFVAKGDRIAIMANTRFEWAITDMATLCLGGVTVPVYASNTEEDTAHILNDSEAKVLILESEEQLVKWSKIRGSCPFVKKVICLATIDDKSVATWFEALRAGALLQKKNPDFFERAIEQVRMKDLATIVYTSGTTGKPKGVMLTHEQIMSELSDVFAQVSVSDLDTSLTFLPFAHIFARVELWAHIYAGFTMGYAENIDKLRDNFPIIRPTFLISVPRIFEKIYTGVISQAESSPLRMKLFSWATKIGREMSQTILQKQKPDVKLFAEYQIAKQLVFDKLKNRMGGRLRFAISGGAPLSKEICEFFHAADLLILEGYGLTETTAGITFNTPAEYKFGTVGKPIGDAQIKIAEDGEILVKSKKIMTGYYNQTAATSEALHDGWFATGDIGEFTHDGFLRITDRKKDLIKTAGGKYIAPQKIENLLKLNKYISNVLVHGDQRKYVVCLITLNEDEIKRIAKAKNISYTEPSVLTKHPEIIKLIREAVAEANGKLAGYESIKNFAILSHDFTIESGELTPSLKVRRKFCDHKYQAKIDELYGPDVGHF